MEFTLKVPDSLPILEIREIRAMMQHMLDRLAVGHVRYGVANRRQRYLTRLIMETKAYKRMGNQEQLINIANYCLLEAIAPENKLFHFDATVGSVTRKTKVKSTLRPPKRFKTGDLVINRVDGKVGHISAIRINNGTAFYDVGWHEGSHTVEEKAVSRCRIKSAE